MVLLLVLLCDPFSRFETMLKRTLRLLLRRGERTWCFDLTFHINAIVRDLDSSERKPSLLITSGFQPEHL